MGHKARNIKYLEDPRGAHKKKNMGSYSTSQKSHFRITVPWKVIIQRGIFFKTILNNGNKASVKYLVYPDFFTNSNWI